MKDSSRVILGATLVIVLILAMVLGLVLVLVAELYCSLLRRRKLRSGTSVTAQSATTSATATVPPDPSFSPPLRQLRHHPPPPPPPLRTLYSQGVLQAPRSFLFPSVAGNSAPPAADVKNQDHSEQLRQFFDSEVTPTTSPHNIGIVPSSPVSLPKSPENLSSNGAFAEQCVYISNPIYDGGNADTPFVTPHTSPSQLESGGSAASSPASPSSVSVTPPLTPMKKLPAAACSVSLRDASSLATSASESISNNGGFSSSSSGSPCTSPSW
ncbi:hypothetical protein NMG60_11013391 [Bertholletia excelsa]